MLNYHPFDRFLESECGWKGRDQWKQGRQPPTWLNGWAALGKACNSLGR